MGGDGVNHHVPQEQNPNRIIEIKHVIWGAGLEAMVADVLSNTSPLLSYNKSYNSLLSFTSEIFKA